MEELLSTPQRTTFLPHSSFDRGNFERGSNAIYPYLSGSRLLINFLLSDVNRVLMLSANIFLDRQKRILLVPVNVVK